MYRGRFDGRLKAKRIPVTTAERSHTVHLSFLRIYLLIAHSKNTQEATDTAVTINEPKPNA
jgi:hypothetical protein